MAFPKLTNVIMWSFLLYFADASQHGAIYELKKNILNQILRRNTSDILIPPANGTIMETIRESNETKLIYNLTSQVYNEDMDNSEDGLLQCMFLGGATVVTINMDITKMELLSEDKMEFTVYLNLRQKWNSDKLKYDSQGQFRRMVINDPNVIWTPDVFFWNEKKGHTRGVNLPGSYVTIFPSGMVLYFRRLSVTVSCPMDLKMFPFDNQECHLQLGSYGLTTDDVLLMWRIDEPVTASRLTTPHFELDKIITTSGVAHLNTGDYSVLIAYFYISRLFGYYLYQVYIPSVVFVILSWVPFWINQKNLIGRLLISLGALFTYSLIIYDFNKHHAKVSCSTCLHWFTGTCLTFLLLSLVETLLVEILAEQKNTDEGQKNTNGTTSRVKSWTAKFRNQTDSLDPAARWALPLTFVLFCIIYFITISVTGETEWMSLEQSNIENTQVYYPGV